MRAAATACIAERSDRCPAARPSASPVSPAASVRPYVAPTSSAIASASDCGSRARAWPSRASTRSSVCTGHLVRPCRWARRRSASTGGRPCAATTRRPGRDLDVPAGSQLVEVVAGDVGVDADLGGDRRRRDAVAVRRRRGVVADEQVDAPARRVAERVGDRRHGGGERVAGGIAPRSGSRHGRYCTYLDSANPSADPPRAGDTSGKEPAHDACHLGAARRRVAPRRGPRAAPLDRRPRHGAARRARRRRGRLRARRPHRGRLPAAQRDPVARRRGAAAPSTG